jgi:uncharacterized repeat protein (TIGR03803 family)
MQPGCGGSQQSATETPPLTAADVVRNSGSYQQLWSFRGPPDGEQPDAGLTAFNGTFYGTTELGGNFGTPCNSCGTVYHITPDGKESVVYRFAGPPDGAFPEADLTVLGRRVYFFLGTTYSGGSGCSGSCGTVFKVWPNGRERVIYSFKGGADGSNPRGGVLALNGDLYYGTTWAGGSSGKGTIYQIQKDGREQVVHSFGSSAGDGAQPVGDLVLFNNELFGVTQTGGAHNAGTIFEIEPGSNREQIVHSFIRNPDGQTPVGLTAYNNVLYGATATGGAYKRGTVFAFDSKDRFILLYAFKGTPKGDGAYPEAPPTVVYGTLYGTTKGGGGHGDGTVYEMTKSGTELVLYSFGQPPDGVHPVAPLAYLNGYLFGTTINGGSGNRAYGTVFKVVRP